MILDILKTNKWLFALLLICFIGAAYLFFKAEPVSGKSDLADNQNVKTGSHIILKQTVASVESRDTEKDKTAREIEELQRKFDEDPRSDDAPALLNAMANLSRQKLGNYKDAVRYYELLLCDYEHWAASAKVYPQLATCYERMGDDTAARGVYKRIMSRFPADSQEYLYAQSQLGIH